jgi:multiple sugar transport system permease protein
VRRAGKAAAIAFLVAWSLVPALWQMATAFKTDAQITRVPTVYLPAPPTLDHFVALWTRKPLAGYLANSFLIAAAATLLAVCLAALAAAALARSSPLARRRGLLALLLITLFPPILLLFPLYEGVRALGWINHPLGLVLPYAALNLPLAVWILESGFRQMPREVNDAARLDGLGTVSRLVRIDAPLLAPVIATAAILVFIFCWNEFMLALTFMTRDSTKTITAGIASIGGASIYEIPWGQLSAAVVVATAPLVALVLLFERRITAGLTRGAVKG